MATRFFLFLITGLVPSFFIAWFFTTKIAELGNWVLFKDFDPLQFPRYSYLLKSTSFVVVGFLLVLFNEFNPINQKTGWRRLFYAVPSVMPLYYISLPLISNTPLLFFNPFYYFMCIYFGSLILLNLALYIRSEREIKHLTKSDELRDN